jgi:hypothetical protein
VIDRLTNHDLPGEQLQRFSQRGFTVFDDFLTSAMVHELAGAVESLQPDPQASRTGRGVAFARRNLLKLDFVSALTIDPSIRTVIEAFAPGAVAVRAILFDKTGSANWTVPWHQDRSIAVRERLDLPGFGPWSIKSGVVHVQPPIEILAQMLTLRFHLDPCGDCNGPLRVIAGTHHRILDQKEVEDSVAGCAQTVCKTGAGGLILMRPLILHASSTSNTSFTSPRHSYRIWPCGIAGESPLGDGLEGASRLRYGT